MTEADVIEVTLLLQGGHEYPLLIDINGPFLKELIRILKYRHQVPSLAQDSLRVTLSGLEAEAIGLYCTHRDLIGLTTSPPIPEALWAACTMQSAQYYQIDNFLSLPEYQSLLDYCKQHEPDFKPSKSGSLDAYQANYRQSLMMQAPPGIAELMVQKFQSVLPTVLHRLDMEHLEPTKIEVQLTAHGDGDYYKIHRDGGIINSRTRRLTYVYYFYEEPKAFTGGELTIYDTPLEDIEFVRPAAHYQQIEPLNNRIVFFDSRFAHEVKPVHCQSPNFSQRRFTVNGWLKN